MKYTLLLLLVLYCCSCYKAADIPATGAPAYSIVATEYDFRGAKGSIADTGLVLTVNQNGSATITLDFSVVSGNPANYSFIFSANSLPPGITITPDSLSFLLNYSSYLTIAAYTDTGYHTVNFKMYNAALGTQTYPVKIHVTP